MMAKLALFDLDHTLLPVDSDREWLAFLARKHYLSHPDRTLSDLAEVSYRYAQGLLNIEEAIAVMVQPLTEHSLADLARYHEEYMASVIRPLIRPEALRLVSQHLEADDLCCLVSATNHFVIAPIARAFGFQHVIGIDLEIRHGRYTGRIVGVPSFQAGKIIRVQEWLSQMDMDFDSFEQVWFYSDSRNDLPLLEKVSHPVCVNPDPVLRETAMARQWPIIDLFQE